MHIVFIISKHEMCRYVEGSGLNDRCPKFLKHLADPSIGVIILEHRDRGTRFGFIYLEQLLAMQGRRSSTSGFVRKNVLVPCLLWREIYADHAGLSHGIGFE
jgi:hypothetical protein